MTDNYQSLLKIRTVTCFVSLLSEDYAVVDTENYLSWKCIKMENAVKLLRNVESALEQAGYTVQTVRLATNPFGRWLPPSLTEAATILQKLDQWLAQHGIDFCALGPALSVQEIQQLCPLIVRTSPRFSCSAVLSNTDVETALACASTVRTLAVQTEPDFMRDGLGNFRFCVTSSCPPCIPFFPAAKAPECIPKDSRFVFAVGLENGSLAQHLLAKCQTIKNVSTIFHQGMTDAILPIQDICQRFEASHGESRFAGIDTSLNPSLESVGSVAGALESLQEIARWGGPGTLAVAAALTKSLQSLPGVRTTGYCGIMLPVCEDKRLAQLTESKELRIADLLSISSVCGVGIDTVPLPGDASEERLAALMLDVAGLADRWQKPLSCRVFPLPGKAAGEYTTFDFPHMINAAILEL